MAIHCKVCGGWKSREAPCMRYLDPWHLAALGFTWGEWLERKNQKPLGGMKRPLYAPIPLRLGR